VATFRFDNKHPQAELGINPIDLLIGAAGGSPLPGRWGVLQALFEIWARPNEVHRAIWASRNILNSAGVLRTYRRLKDPTLAEKRADPIAEYTKAANLSLVDSLEPLSHLIHIYSEHLPREDQLLGQDKRARVRKFRLPSGLEFFYTFSYFSAESDVESRRYGWFSGQGPYVVDVPGAKERLCIAVAEQIWVREGNADLQLSCIQGDYGNQFILSNIGAPDDYVSEGAPSTWTNLQKLAERCRAFQSKHLSRKILFYGPPGTGKTTLARNLAREVGEGHTLRIEASAIEAAGTRSVMRFVELLRPRVILFDDLDRCRDSAEEILHYLEKAGDVQIKSTNETLPITTGLIVVGTINAIDMIDPALLRPGRFDEVIEVNEPPDEHRRAIIKHYLRVFELNLDEEQLLVQMNGFSPADIREVLRCCASVGLTTLESEMERVTRQRQLYAGERVQQFLTSSRPRGIAALRGT
jgi:hypothetical protein